MKKKVNIFGVICIVIFAVIILFAFVSKGSNQGVEFDPSSYDRSQDIINLHNLRVEAKVNKDNTINVTENFDVTFNKDGLREVIRVVPYKNIVYREIDGKVTEEVVASNITNIEAYGDVGKETFYTDEIEGTVTIGIKNYNYYKKGETYSFTIKYDYEMGKDYNQNFDEVYFNIVGVNSLLTIENVSFMIELPEDVKEDNIAVYFGEEGSTSELGYNYSGNIIVGSIDKLKPTEGITFRVVYPDGYLNHTSSINTFEIAVIVLTLVIIVLAIIYFVKFKQKDKVIEPVELTVPAGITPFKAEYYDKYNCSDKSVVASIVRLASKGYIHINEGEEDIELIKIKEMLDSEELSLRALYNAIFKKNSRVKIKDLNIDFAESANAIKQSEKIKTSAILFEKKPQKSGRIIKGVIFAIFAFVASVLILTNVNYFGFATSFYNKKLLYLSLCILIYGLMFISTRKAGICRYVCLALITFMLFYLYFGLGFKYVNDNFIYLVFILLGLVASLFVSGDTKYAQAGEKEKGLALGFKRFIELCEVDQIKAFAEENPSYYYDVLPYAYVYDLSDVWIKKFETINLTVPNWITSDINTISDYAMFSIVFNRFTSRTVYRAEVLNHQRIERQFASSSGSSSSGGRSSGRSGGSFGGGGFSGGGRGGGGFGAR